MMLGLWGMFFDIVVAGGYLMMHDVMIAGDVN